MLVNKDDYYSADSCRFLLILWRIWNVCVIL